VSGLRARCGPSNGFRSLVEVVINEAGAVESAAMVVSVGNTYDKTLLVAAGRWQFVPAMANGAPVKLSDAMPDPQASPRHRARTFHCRTTLPIGMWPIVTLVSRLTDNPAPTSAC
jgi:TonB family protein